MAARYLWNNMVLFYTFTGADFGFPPRAILAPSLRARTNDRKTSISKPQQRSPYDWGDNLVIKSIRNGRILPRGENSHT
ncbi:hypothetical protein RRG08_060229 [Elysia crispata]|uniref:Uncharacterized protein n=1 Tax=Elysia crispata TaxID=231223 RepID=A0AAE0ZVP6_9GAST|nr:hypothetical protein RRG08_060229 [Elysia crispata]